MSRGYRSSGIFVQGGKCVFIPGVFCQGLSFMSHTLELDSTRSMDTHMTRLRMCDIDPQSDLINVTWPCMENSVVSDLSIYLKCDTCFMPNVKARQKQTFYIKLSMICQQYTMGQVLLALLCKYLITTPHGCSHLLVTGTHKHCIPVN